MTDYGDAVDDEWLIVHMLRELTRSHPNVWARVSDTDGEFLLVEAANVLPKWLSPETDQNRVWMHKGKLLIIPSTADEPSKHHAGVVSLQEAVRFIKTSPSDLVHSTFVESEAFYRLERYPAQVADSLHHSLVTIPRKLTNILHSLPKSVAPAVEAFYLRDPVALRPIISPSAALTFPPEDLVTTSVRFSKVLFAQLRSQRFDTPPRWLEALKAAGEDTASTHETRSTTARIETGMKLTCGFEMLAVKAEKSKSRVVREVAILLQDMEEDGEEALPKDEEIDLWQDAHRDDDEAWMDINYEDFERELEGRRAQSSGQSKSGFGDAQTQADLKKIVSRFEAFLNDDAAGLEGAELHDMDVDDDDDDDDDSDSDEEDSDFEDKEVSFDEDEFARMMRQMMGLPSTESSQTASAKGKAPVRPATNKPVAQGVEEDAQIQELTSQMEAELKGHGALRLDAPGNKTQKLKSTSEEPQQEGTKTAKDTALEDDESEEENDEEVDIDYNLAKNLLESFKSQAGMAGPTGNLLGMMGIQLPRDEDDGKENSHNPDEGPQQGTK